MQEELSASLCDDMGIQEKAYYFQEFGLDQDKKLCIPVSYYSIGAGRMIPRIEEINKLIQILEECKARLTDQELAELEARLKIEDLRRLAPVRTQKRPTGYTKHRNFVFERDGFRCVYCGAWQEENLTLDHVIPQSRGGSDDPNNLVCCCRSCNSSKGDRTPDEWMGAAS